MTSLLGFQSEPGNECTLPSNHARRPKLPVLTGSWGSCSNCRSHTTPRGVLRADVSVLRRVNVGGESVMRSALTGGDHCGRHSVVSRGSAGPRSGSECGPETRGWTRGWTRGGPGGGPGLGSRRALRPRGGPGEDPRSGNSPGRSQVRGAGGIRGRRGDPDLGALQSRPTLMAQPTETASDHAGQQGGLLPGPSAGTRGRNPHWFPTITGSLIWSALQLRLAAPD